MSVDQGFRMGFVTIRQAKCKNWRRERRLRITSTKVYSLINAFLKQKDHHELVKICLGKKLPKKDLPQFVYGREREDKAKAKFCEVTKLKVYDIGLVCKHLFSWFGASPDGIIRSGSDIGILEVKCLYSFRDDEKIGKVKCLNKKGNLRKKTLYYNQIQMNCWVTGATFAYLFCFTDQDYKLVPVEVDTDFA